tara:strand:+ start:439 stop:564 length:126 start_codon:yes stop_codon:yes gene_type:complete
MSRNGNEVAALSYIIFSLQASHLEPLNMTSSNGAGLRIAHD